MASSGVFLWLWWHACKAGIMTKTQKWTVLGFFLVAWFIDGYWIQLFKLAWVAVGLGGAGLGLWR